jgi:hypothetical protein
MRAKDAGLLVRGEVAAPVLAHCSREESSLRRPSK